MNPPNLLTLSRIPILFAITGLLYAPFRGAASLAFVLFVLGALTDWADGYVARRMGLVSDFGKLMDALSDKVFMVGVFIALLAVGALPEAWCLPLLLLILSREFLITGLRLVAASSGIVLAAERAGKHKTVTQIVAAALLLAAIGVGADFPGGGAERLAAWLRGAGLVFFVIATALTVSSGTIYLVKHWAVFTGGKAGKGGDDA